MLMQEFIFDLYESDKAEKITLLQSLSGKSALIFLHVLLDLASHGNA